MIRCSFLEDRVTDQFEIVQLLHDSESSPPGSWPNMGLPCYMVMNITDPRVRMLVVTQYRKRIPVTSSLVKWRPCSVYQSSNPSFYSPTETAAIKNAVYVCGDKRNARTMLLLSFYYFDLGQEYTG